MKLLLPLFTFLMLISDASAQSIEGRIIDDKGKPIPFASLGYHNANSGTTADENGFFKLIKRERDSIKITAIGYHPSIYYVGDTISFLKVVLNPKIEVLSEVVLKARRKTSKKMNLGFFGMHDHRFTDRGLIGQQIATFIANPNKIRGYVEEVKFELRDIDNTPLSMRIRIFSLDTKNGGPGKEILEEPIIIKPSQLRRKTKVNLKKYNLEFPPDGVFISLEWICQSSACLSEKNVHIPLSPGNLGISPYNTRFSNFREVKWFAYPFFRDGYGTQNVGITVSY